MDQTHVWMIAKEVEYLRAREKMLMDDLKFMLDTNLKLHEIIIRQHEEIKALRERMEREGS